uniref:Uncharacterized protein n=1 Tax=Ditylum brightwellii TaxID=49249 RepID=A0A7S4S0A2_9STRA
MAGWGGTSVAGVRAKIEENEDEHEEKKEKKSVKNRKRLDSVCSQTSSTASNAKEDISGVRKLLRRASFLGGGAHPNLIRSTRTVSNGMEEQGKQMIDSARKHPTRRASITAMIGGVFRPLHNHMQDHEQIVQVKRKSATQLLEERERSRVFVYDRRGSTGRISKALYNEDIVPLKLRLEPIINLEQLGSVLVVNLMSVRPEYPPQFHDDYNSKHEGDCNHLDDEQNAHKSQGTMRGNEPQEYGNENDHSEQKVRPSLSVFDNLDRPLKLGSCPSAITSGRRQTCVVSGNTQDFNKQESEQEGNIHRKAIGKDKMRRTASLTYESAKLNSLLPKEENTTTKDFDELVSEHEDIIMEARRTTKVVGRALKSLGVASPLRRVTEVIPKFGGLHHHLRLQLMRHKVDHVEVRQRKHSITKYACEKSVVLSSIIHKESGEDDPEASKKSRMTVDIRDLTGVSFHGINGRFEQESSPLQQDLTKNAMVPINVEFANDTNLHEQCRKSNNYATSWHSCDDSSSDGSSGSYEDDDIDVIATYFGMILGVSKNNISSNDSNDDVSGMFVYDENDCQFTSREMERSDDIAFVANFMYSFPGNATSFDEVLKPTSLCISSGYRLEFLMSIFLQYRDDSMSNSTRNGFSATPSASKDDADKRSTSINKPSSAELGLVGRIWPLT